MKTMKIQLSNNRTQEILNYNDVNDKELQRTTQEVEEALNFIEDLKFFLTTAPVDWQENQIIRRYYLDGNQGFISCVFWDNLYYITGTDIVKICMYRMQKFGRIIVQKKKFEEGIFSDLRNLKCGVDATLEQPKSEFLAFLFKNMCLKTQKKQKVFFWFSVPHDKIFADALERDLKKEIQGQPATTKALHEPALSFQYDSQQGRTLYEQLLNHMDTQRILTTQSTEMELEDPISNPVKINEIKSEQEKVTNINDSNNSLNTANDLPSTFPIQDTELESQNLEPVSEIKNDGGEQMKDDDFPLSYFPISVEYPNQQEIIPPLLSSTIPQQLAYDDRYFELPPDPNYNPHMAMPVPFPYQMTTPFIQHPKSSGRSKFNAKKNAGKSQKQTIEVSNNGKIERITSASLNTYQKYPKSARITEYPSFPTLDAFYQPLPNMSPRYQSYGNMPMNNYHMPSSEYGSYSQNFMSRLLDQPDYEYDNFSPFQNGPVEDYSMQQDFPILNQSLAQQTVSNAPSYHPNNQFKMGSPSSSMNPYMWAPRAGSHLQYPLYTQYPQVLPQRTGQVSSGKHQKMNLSNIQFSDSRTHIIKSGKISKKSTNKKPKPHSTKDVEKLSKVDCDIDESFNTIENI
ncbi:STE domain-containing protein NDAI_0C04470 [Naumovozyma dairenensis CBS 421]|uniref:Uncharacterized protein n=1 Tax=Naumovozyma dairenensis (strain ATCC 10597 / BCRC 20456 / CBS 421 / NBRC 0211 / NRRL Y-12639) TaxID=1071378 RepID=G0W8J6_NAUDC|nr:hypothetical protein NDAI_0C04470 [Naumovozyma dairenensis CBS 421]CCD24107.1 hypothetical protein NDAI_0C04470 [Naumovozyma dairenensis CBS 421]